MCICEPIHKIADIREAMWRNKRLPLEDRIEKCLRLYEQELREDARIFEMVPKETK